MLLRAARRRTTRMAGPSAAKRASHCSTSGRISNKIRRLDSRTEATPYGPIRAAEARPLRSAVSATACGSRIPRPVDQRRSDVSLIASPMGSCWGRPSRSSKYRIEMSQRHCAPRGNVPHWHFRPSEDIHSMSAVAGNPNTAVRCSCNRMPILMRTTHPSK